MKTFSKEIINNQIILKNLQDHTKLVVMHYPEEHTFDTIFVEDYFSLEFIEYIVEELKKSKDIAILFSFLNSSLLEKKLYKKNLRVLNYRYTLRSCKGYLPSSYTISSVLDEESKHWFLDKLNKSCETNQKYLYSSVTDKAPFGESWFAIDNDSYLTRTYCQNGKIVGMVDYKVFLDNVNETSFSHPLLNTNNKIGIRCIFSEEKDVLEDILTDLFLTYKKEIFLPILYTDKVLLDVIKKLGGHFTYCQYILVNGKTNR